MFDKKNSTFIKYDKENVALHNHIDITIIVPLPSCIQNGILKALLTIRDNLVSYNTITTTGMKFPCIQNI